MKKSTLKQELALAITKEVISTKMLRGAIEKLNDTEEALERRRILYDRLANHSTTQSPKSMKEMVESLYDISHIALKPNTPYPAFNELPQLEQDQWMDRLLTILN